MAAAATDVEVVAAVLISSRALWQRGADECIGCKSGYRDGERCRRLGLGIEFGWIHPHYKWESPAPPELLKLFSCKCKKGCRGGCTCLKAGLKCSVMCATCSGETCQNAALIIIEEDDDDETQENPNEPQDNHDAPPMMAYSPMEVDDDDDDPPIVADVPVEDTTSSGHYTAYYRHLYEYNDSLVSSISSNSLVSGDAYILFYQQEAHPKYKFNYGVQDTFNGDNRSKKEQRDGDSVKVYYTEDNPDGTLRTVHYSSDDQHGFNTVVERKETAIYLAPAAHSAPVQNGDSGDEEVSLNEEEQENNYSISH
ncbi:unnamed protein product [Phaedon cochleariae]|uniref:Uncharacterized protein n=1 Tax=Phaedon cochleariae TaxID=80249 RepID=A0A9N9S899_PHACE|nr:unnamed protein product [Phaedon cochleariae]